MSIICGTDLSDASAGALDVALALCKLRKDREVVLVHVADDNAKELVLSTARKQLDAQAKSRAGYGTIRTELILGPADETLARFADTESSDLIVIAARSSGKDNHLGSTANAIVSRADVPVIAVRDPVPWLQFAAGKRPLRLMIGVDDSAVCDLAIQWTHKLRTIGQVDVVLGAIYYPDDACEYYGLDRKSMVDGDPEVEQLMTRSLLRRFGGIPPTWCRARVAVSVGSAITWSSSRTRRRPMRSWSVPVRRAASAGSDRCRR
jgi:nucleotide-binding universal stress UspA family protein